MPTPNPVPVAARRLTYSPYIAHVGIELEGAWNERPSNFHFDGSVRDLGSSGYDGPDCDCDDPDCDESHDNGSGSRAVGEVASPPLRLDRWPAFVRDYYPDDHNDTCGLHVHLSTVSILDYQRLMEPAFYDRVFVPAIKVLLATLSERNRTLLRYRLNGRNHYCGAGCNALVQANDGPEADRYRHLNFDIAKHGTVECRLFPMFTTASVAIRCVDTYLRTVHGYLAGFGSRKRATRSIQYAASLTLDPQSFRRHLDGESEEE